MSNLKVNTINDASGGSAAKLYGVSMRDGGTGWVNRIINGNMVVAQRGTSFAAASGYTLDRWNINKNAGVVTVTQNSDVPSENQFQNSLRVEVTTADTSIAAGDIFKIDQRIEGYNSSDLIGNTFTASFWVRSSKTGTHCISFGNNSGSSYVSEYIVNAANTWEYKNVVVDGGLDSSGTWGTTNGLGVVVSWALAAGTTYQTTADSWQTGVFFATANQVNCLDAIGNIFAITGCQLEKGSVATPFERRDYGRELMMCQRYYWKNRDSNFFVSGYNSGSGVIYADIFNPVNMRAVPTSTLSGFANSNASNASVNSPTRQRIRVQSIITSTGAGYSTFDIAVDSEL